MASRSAPLLLAAVLLLAPRLARADVDDTESSYDPGPAERRSDFALGAHLGVATGEANGYPNSLEKIDDPAYSATTSFGVGPAWGFWLGGALRDWFVFGVGLAGATLSGNEVKSSSLTYLVHIEAYPLFARGGVFRDLGLVAEFGAAGREIMKGSESVADGGAMSVVTLGAVYEPLRLGSHFSLGPTLLVTHQFSQSLNATYGIGALRIAYYGGP